MDKIYIVFYGIWSKYFFKVEGRSFLVFVFREIFCGRSDIVFIFGKILVGREVG